MSQFLRNDMYVLHTHMMRSLCLFFSFQGKMLYTLAQKRCGNFGTCGGADGITGTAAVNDAVLELITTGSGYLLDGKCAEAEDAKEKIVELMSVPLIQATLRYACRTACFQLATAKTIESTRLYQIVFLYRADDVCTVFSRGVFTVQIYDDVQQWYTIVQQQV